MRQGEFNRTIHELARDGPEFSLVIFVAGAILVVLWLLWLCLARVAVYRSSDGARIVLGRSYEADSTVSGRVVGVHVALEQQVEANQVLVELDSQAERRELAEDKVKMAALTPQIEQLQAAIDAGQQAARSASQTGAVEIQQAAVRWRQAVQAAQTSANVAKRYEMAQGVVPEIDLLKAEQQARSDESTARALSLDIDRYRETEAKEASDRTSQIEQLRASRAQLIEEQDTTAANIRRLEYEIEKRLVHAPVSGRVAGLSVLRIGEFVSAGAEIATIVPPERVRAIADFAPAAALGVIRPGQSAWIHLSGFPWTQYGSISAVVASVASEPTDPAVGAIDGSYNRESQHSPDKVIRVEFTVDSRSAPLIPLQYGLVGTVEVEIDRVAPATLIMRTVGRLLTKPAKTQIS